MIFELLGRGQRIKITPELVRLARDRQELGNPPGKKESLGDAVIWEALLAGAPDDADLHFVADDRHWLSPLGDYRFNSYLTDEWAEEKSSAIAYYPRLSQFFATHYPQIKAEAEVEKELLIRDLSNSGSFAQTHAVVAALRKFADFTAAQLNAILLAVHTNNQVSLIVRDTDVEEFIKKAIAGREAELDPVLLADLKQRFSNQ